MPLSDGLFAPHQDDETLGCGGTIIRKRVCGADVDIVFMTDGSNSHPHLQSHISAEELKSLRTGEALEACRLLGVEERRVHFLEFKDGALEQSKDAAIERVGDLLRGRRPEEVLCLSKRIQREDLGVTTRLLG